MITDEKLEEFEDLAKPLIKFLNDNFHPMMKIIITTDNAELVEGYANIHTDEYVKD